MKTAEEVAAKLFVDLGGCEDLHQDHCKCKAKIAQALEAFAQERVKEESILCKWHSGYRRFCSTCVKECEDKARAEAFEEAAKIADKTDLRLTLSGKTVGDTIRDLKGSAIQMTTQEIKESKIRLGDKP